MARISTYPIISTPSANDLLIGTDVDNLNITKNFTVAGIGTAIGSLFIPYVGATGNVNLGVYGITGSGFIVNGGLSTQFLKADGSLDATSYVPSTRILTINGTSYDLSADRSWTVSGLNSLTTLGTGGASTYLSNVLNIPIYQSQGNYITDLSGEATASGPGNASVVLNNSAVIGKILTGLIVSGGTITSTDTILQAFGKIQNQINSVAGGLDYQGTWNASTNTPILQSSIGNNGEYYIVDVAGSTNLNGITDWQIGDWAIFNGVSWQKIDNSESVSSVFGRMGAVTAQSGDYTTTLVTEGTNLYYLDSRARSAISSSATGLTYTTATGIFTLTSGYSIPTTASQASWNSAYNDSIISAAVTGTSTKTLTLNQQDGGTITASWSDLNTDAVTSVFGRVGAIVAQSGDYTTTLVTEGTNLYFTNTRARAAVSLTTTGSSGAATYSNISGVFNIPNYTLSGLGGVPLTRTLTINGSTFDLSLDRTWSVGTVTSVNMTVPLGLTISGNPITSSGSLALTLTPGYSIPTTASQATWTTAYNDSIVSAAVTGTTTKTLTLNQQDGGTVSASWTDTDTGLTSVGLSMPLAFSVANSPLTSNGTLAVTAVGTSSQYIRGDGQLATFPSSAGGGSSVSYYLNGSINSSVVGYKQLSNNAIIGGGTDFTLTGNGLIAQFLTDVGNPNRIQIPGGAWNFEMFFNSSSNGGSEAFYVELLKYDGTTFTLIASSSTIPESITGGTSTDLYLTSLAVPTTTLLTTDRLAIRVYIVNNSGARTVTLHTENNTLCEIITTFAGGVSSLNGLTANTQYLAVGTSGTDFNINSLVDTHTFNLPTASAINRGALSTSDWTTFNSAYNNMIVSAAVTGTTTKTLTLNQQDGGTVTASWSDLNTDAVTSVFGRTGAVIAQSGDYTTTLVTEGTNLYYTDARARQSISLTTIGTSGISTYNNVTGILNIPDYSADFSAIPEDVLPLFDEVYDIGSVTKKWYDLYLTNTIYLGNTARIGVDIDGDIITNTNFISQGTISALIGDFGDVTISGNKISYIGTAYKPCLEIDSCVSVNGALSTTGGISTVGDMDITGQYLINGAPLPIPVSVYERGTGLQSIQADNTGTVASGNYSVVSGGKNNQATAGYNVVVGGENNVTYGFGPNQGYAFIGTGYFNGANYNCFIGGGFFNSALNSGDVIVGGGNNTASGNGGFIGSGNLNNISGLNGIIVGGANNTIGPTSSYSAILGGQFNNTNNFDRVMIVGDFITANRDAATFVGQLSIMNIPASSAGLPSGAVWRNGTVLNIVP